MRSFLIVNQLYNLGEKLEFTWIELKTYYFQLWNQITAEWEKTIYSDMIKYSWWTQKKTKELSKLLFSVVLIYVLLNTNRKGKLLCQFNVPYCKVLFILACDVSSMSMYILFSRSTFNGIFLLQCARTYV